MEKNIHGNKRLKRKLERNGDLNRLPFGTNMILSVLFILVGLMCIIPMVFIIMISISSESSIAQHGYQFFPDDFSSAAYNFLITNMNMLLNAASISLVVTVLGTIMGLFLTISMGYVISRSDYRFRSFFTWIVFIPMIFNGGLISTYFINTTVFHLKDTIWALILPLLVNSFHIIICKTYFKTSLPESIVESAKIDGASQFRIFFGIVLPICLPLLATIALFLSFAYWNDWWQAMLYINKTGLRPLQSLLYSIDRNVEYMLKNAATLGVSQTEMLRTMPTESFRMAIAVVVILPISLAYPFFQRYFISGLTVGAVKG